MAEIIFVKHIILAELTSICAMKLALMSLAVQLKQIFFHCNDNNIRLFRFRGKELQRGTAFILILLFIIKSLGKILTTVF